MSTSKPVVSVLLMTFNHIDFVDEALKSIADQACDVQLEIILNDDLSTDGTIDRLEAFAATSPYSCRMLVSEHNLGPNRAVARGLRAATGDYIALLDGDDRWSDPTKLQRQVEVLVARPDLAVSFHDVLVIEPDGTPTDRRWNDADQKIETTIDDLVYGCYAHTSSCMIRRTAITPLPLAYDEFVAPLTDWPLLVIAGATGGLHYQPRIMSEYRFHAGGQYQGMPRRSQVDATARAYRRLEPLLPTALRHRLATERSVFLRQAAEEATAAGRRRDAAAHLWAVATDAAVRRNPRTTLRALGRLAALASRTEHSTGSK